jgi:uncharacterized protein YuzE
MNAAIRFTYDDEVDALYVALADGKVFETIEIEESVYVDVDAKGRPLGVEFVSAADLVPFLRRHGGEFIVPVRVKGSAALSTVPA